MRYIDVIEELSKSKHLRQGDVINFSKELLQIAAMALGCKRSNAWLFDKEQEMLHSINAFDREAGTFSIENSLSRNDLPNYFKYLTKNKIIVSNDAVASEMNAELIHGYILPNGIKSMIDVPIRSEGKMIGVICFESVESSCKWSEADQKFTQSLAQLFSLAIETNEKNTYRKELEKLVKQKEVLLYEINHRVKNNMAVIIGLINMQKAKSKDQFHEENLEELKNKIYSMAIVQNHLHNNKSLVKVELSMYLKEVIQNLHDSYRQGKTIELLLDLDKVVIDISKGIPIGLIANEILTNSFKYAFPENRTSNELQVSVKRNLNTVAMKFKDNGTGYNPEVLKSGMGLELIQNLTEQIDGELEIKVEQGVEINIVFPVAD